MTIYEPRAFWDVLRVQADYQPQQVELERTHFYNGTRWPITITKLGIAPLSYGYASGTGIVASRNVESIVQNLRVFLAARQRYDLTVPGGLSGRSFTTQPSSPMIGTFSPGAQSAARLSSRYGAVYGRFDQPLQLPSKGAAEFTPSIATYLSATPGLDYPLARFGVAWHEFGSNLSFKGQGRIKQNVDLLPGTSAPASQFAGWIPSSPINAPVGPDPVNALTMPFPPSHVFTAREFVAQDASTRPGVSSSFSGLTVMIDQIGMDDSSAKYPPGNCTLSMLANHVGTRARTTEGGTKQDWWRPGMPLSLACPTISPAFIHHFSAPFTMEPGEQLEVFVNVPVDSGQPQPDVYSAAIAVMGYATIEGVTV